MSRFCFVHHFARCALSQTQDYYTYTAVKYAKDAGHQTIVELLGGEEDAEGWAEVEEVYIDGDPGDSGKPKEPSGGLWICHMDPQTELAYYMNDETGAHRPTCYCRWDVKSLRVNERGKVISSDK